MTAYFFLKLAGHAVLPPASLLLAIVAAIASTALGFRRFAVFVVVLAILQTGLLGIPVVADALVAPLERQARIEAAKARPCCYFAIVVLGGGIVPASPPAIASPHLVDGADRTWHAARLFRQDVAPRVIVSGGTSISGQTEAQAMEQFLTELGVPDRAILRDDNARNTIENIAEVRRLVGDERVALVTSAYHMPRAMRLARLAGLNASAFPTDWQVPRSALPDWARWLPNLEASLTASRALREHLAAWYDWRERRLLASGATMPGG